MRETCPVCTGSLSKGLREWHHVCPDCSYERASLTPGINRQETHKTVDEEAREVGLKTLRQSNFAKLVRVLKQVRPGRGRLLDVGCAHGWFLEATANSFDALGIEPDEAVYKATAARGLPIRLGYFPTVLRDDEKFDIIVFNDVFEHIPDSEQVLAACHDRLTDDGVLVLNLPSSRGSFYRVSKFLHRLGFGSFFERLWQKGMPSPHLHYFNTENLCKLLHEHKFSAAAKGTLPVLRLEGLYTRISCSGNMSALSVGFIYSCIAMALPILRVLPSDIIYVIATKQK